VEEVKESRFSEARHEESKDMNLTSDYTVGAIVKPNIGSVPLRESLTLTEARDSLEVNPESPIKKPTAGGLMVISENNNLITDHERMNSNLVDLPEDYPAGNQNIDKIQFDTEKRDKVS
jgi:hypothetical protein